MIILGVPLVLMYEGAIWVVQFLDARRSRQVDAAISAAAGSIGFRDIGFTRAAFSG